MVARSSCCFSFFFLNSLQNLSGQPVIRVSWSGATAKFYLNGALVSEQTALHN